MSRSAFFCNTYLKVQEDALIVSGLWPLRLAQYFPESLSGAIYYLERFHIWFSFLNLLHLTAMQVKTIYDIWGAGIDELYPHCQEYLVAHHIMVLIVIVQLQHDRIAEVFDLINSNLRPRSAFGLTYTTMEKSNKLAKLLTVTWVVFCVIGTLHHALLPILDGSTRRLPVKSWYPFETTASPIFEILYVLQTMGQLQSGFVYSSVITLSFSLAILLCGQYDMLYCSIHNLMHTAMIKRGDPKYLNYLKTKQIDWKEVNKDWIAYEHSEEYMEDLNSFPRKIMATESRNDHNETDEWYKWDEEILEALKDCVAYHSFILEMVHAAEESLRYILMTCWIHYTLLLALLIFALSSHLVVDNTFYHIIIYMSLTYMLNCSMCYPPHILRYQSTRVVEAIIQSPWHMCGPKVRKMMVVLMANARKPSGFTCGKLFSVDLELCATITKASFSYFMLLRTVEGK